MGRIKLGWSLTKQCWQVLKSDKSLMIFPVLSIIFALLAAVLVWAPALLFSDLHSLQQTTSSDKSIQFSDVPPLIYVAIVVSAYISACISTFFNVALVACAQQSFLGNDTNLQFGLAAARQRLGAIMTWAIVITFVQLILRALEERLGALGSIIVRLVGVAWSAATFFVVPVLVMEDVKNPWTALKRSGSIIRHQWGESVVGVLAISSITSLGVLAIILVGIAGGILLAGVSVVAVIVWAALCLTFILLLALISATLNQIFRLAVYMFTQTGQAPAAFTADELQAAFRAKSGR